MADKNLNSITFPGLPDKYKVAQVADEYSASLTYAVGDIVNHLGTTYRCTTAITTAENWTAGHWTAVKIADEVTDLKSAFLYSLDTQRELFYNGSPSGTVAVEINVTIPAGTYRLTIGDVTSTDTDNTTSRIIFYSGSSYLTVVDASRGTATDTTVTLSQNVTKIYFYAGHSYGDSTGDTVSYTNVAISKNTGLNSRITNIESDIVSINGDIDKAEIGISNNVNIIDFALENQKRLFYSCDVSGTLSKTESVSIPAGTYTIDVDSISSTDTDSSTSRIVFYNRATSLSSIDFNRSNEKQSQNVTLGQNVTGINFYAGKNYSESTGDSFSYSGVVIYADTELNERFEEIESSISGINTEIEDINSNLDRIENNLNGDNLFSTSMVTSSTSSITYTTDENSVTVNTTASGTYQSANTGNIIQSLLEVGKTYRLSAKAEVLSGTPVLKVCVRGKSGNVDGTAVALNLTDGETSYIDFTVDQYMTYFSFVTAWSTAKLGSSAKYSDISIIELNGSINNINKRLDNLSNPFSDNPFYKKIITNNPVGTQQGACSDGEYIYCAQGYDYHDGEFASVLLRKYKISDRTVEDKYFPNVEVGHANDMTYNPTTGYLYLVHMVDGKISIFDTDLNFIEQIVVTSPTSNTPTWYRIAYDRLSEQFYLMSTSTSVLVYDSDFQYVKSMTPDVYTNITAQGMEVDGEYIYLVFYTTTKQYVYIYDLNCKHVKTITFDITDESETIAYDWNGSMFLICYDDIYYIGIKAVPTYQEILRINEIF